VGRCAKRPLGYGGQGPPYFVVASLRWAKHSLPPMAGGRKRRSTLLENGGRGIPGQPGIITTHQTDVHRELRRAKYLSKYEQCPDPSEPVWKGALRRFATKRGLLPSAPIDELGTVPYPHVVVGHDDGVVCKEGKAPDGSTAGAMDTRAERGLSEENTQGEGDTEMRPRWASRILQLRHAKLNSTG
jgi:hypothetical protein